MYENALTLTIMVAHRAAYMVRQREAQINKAKFESFPTVLNRRHPQQQCGVWGWEVWFSVRRGRVGRGGGGDISSLLIVLVQ